MSIVAPPGPFSYSPSVNKFDEMVESRFVLDHSDSHLILGIIASDNSKMRRVLVRELVWRMLDTDGLDRPWIADPEFKSWWE